MENISVLKSGLAIALFLSFSLTLVAQSHWKTSGNNIYHQGKIAIGTNETPQGDYLLYTPKIAVEEIAIQLSNYWADYVFHPDYKLLSLEKLNQFILDNGHLPNMPTATEVETNGLQVAPATGRLLEKIEELQLYLIEDQKRDEALSRQVDNLRSN